tara:strand:+ start:21567 stop:21773 length:207 start_codon:yes stop_codon:yes gene_type:complete
MKNQEQTIPCPVCNTKIHFDAIQLMQGVKFKCPNEQCGSSIGLSPESKINTENVMDKFNDLKDSIDKK